MEAYRKAVAANPEDAFSDPSIDAVIDARRDEIYVQRFDGGLVPATEPLLDAVQPVPDRREPLGEPA